MYIITRSIDSKKVVTFVVVVVSGKGLPVMDFSTRMRIALGSAKGLAYLHEDCKFQHSQYISHFLKTKTEKIMSLTY